MITIKGTYSSSLVTLTSDNPFVISKPFLRNGQRHIPFVTVRIPSFFLHELITYFFISTMNDNSGSGSATHFKVLYQHFFLKLAFQNYFFFCVVFCWALFGVCFVSFSVCPPYFLSSHLWLLNSNLFCVLQSVNRILE